jgi:Protein of unknown function (DUF3551)
MRRPDEAGRTVAVGRVIAAHGGSREIDMRVMLLAAALAVLFGGGRPVEARPWYSWCARNLAGVDMDCEFISQQSCLQTVSGVSGFCMPNPAPPPPRRHRRNH